MTIEDRQQNDTGRRQGQDEPSETSTARATHRRTLAGNIISLYLLQGLNYLVPMAVLPYLVRVLGMDLYGLLAFAQSFAQYFTIFTDYGFNYSATRSIARSLEDGDAISRLYSTVLFIKITLTAIGAVVLWVVVLTVPRFHRDAEFFLVAYLAVVGNALFPIWYFQGIAKMRYISIIAGGSRVAAAVALFIFVHHPQDAQLANLIQSLGILISGITGFLFSFTHFHIKLRWPGFADLRSALVEGWHLFVSTAAISMYTNTNLFLVGMLSTNLEAGYFAAAQKLIRAMQGLVQPVAQAIFPHVNLLAAQSKERALVFTRRILRWTGTLMLVPSLLVIVFAKPIAVIVLGHAGAGSAPVIRWIGMLPFLIAVSNILGVQTMIPFGLDKQFSRILIAAGILNLLIAIPMTHFFAAQGAGAAVLIAETFVTVVMLIVLERRGIRIFRSKGAVA